MSYNDDPQRMDGRAPRSNRFCRDLRPTAPDAPPVSAGPSVGPFGVLTLAELSDTILHLDEAAATLGKLYLADPDAPDGRKFLAAEVVIAETCRPLKDIRRRMVDERLDAMEQNS